jgi:diguanylate cyclase (GGDEF)-like protein/hemerythrin-like metal-binding protein
MERKIKEEMKKADRYNQPLSMAILDLDHFKRVNDTWGHPVGDDVLKHISTLIGSLLRESDTFARMGGEEFAIVMPGTDVEGAYMVSEKVRKAVEEDVHSIIGKITISIGVGERLRSESYIKWYKRVDAALYHAKDSGRNMTMRAEQLEQLPIASVEVKWKQEWESGNEEIDNQHKELLHLGNNLIHMSFDEEPTDKIMEQLELLLEHIEHHFHCEENMQKEIGYPYYELHSKSHKTLIHRAHNLKQQYLKEELKATAFFTFLVDDVIMGHLLDEDVKFYPYTRNKDL